MSLSNVMLPLLISAQDSFHLQPRQVLRWFQWCWVCAHTLSLPREILFTFYYCQWPMKPVGYHLSKHRNMNNSNFRRFRHKSSLTSGHKINGLQLLRVAQISSHIAVSHAVKKLNVNTVPLIQISLKMMHWTHEKEKNQTTTDKKPKTFGRCYTKKVRAAVTEKGENSSQWNCSAYQNIKLGIVNCVIIPLLTSIIAVIAEKQENWHYCIGCIFQSPSWKNPSLWKDLYFKRLYYTILIKQPDSSFSAFNDSS